jgi:hypothetical protein
MDYLNFISSLPKEHLMLKYKDDRSDFIRKYIKQFNDGVYGYQNSGTFESWIEKKLRTIRENPTDIKIISSELGEIRAYGIIKQSFFGSDLKYNTKDGPDFYMDFPGGQNTKYEGFNNKLDDDIYIALHTFPDVQLENMFINWPINNLRERVDYYRNIGEALNKNYKISYRK